MIRHSVTVMKTSAMLSEYGQYVDYVMVLGTLIHSSLSFQLNI